MSSLTLSLVGMGQRRKGKCNPEKLKLLGKFYGFLGCHVCCIFRGDFFCGNPAIYVWWEQNQLLL